MSAESDQFYKPMVIPLKAPSFIHRFIFTNLDPENPARKFSFLLQVNDNDKYEITDCQPSLDVSLLVELANVLNETDDMSYLVRRMSEYQLHLRQ